MLHLDRVLVVDGSRFARDLLLRLMRRHARAAHGSAHGDDAREWISRHPDASLVICDLDVPGGGGLALLEFVAGLEGRRPPVLLTGRRFEEGVRSRARQLGAIACVTRPVTFRAIARAVAATRRPLTGIAPRRYAHPPARAHLIDPGALGGDAPIAWNVHDLSASGALLDTRGPIPVGTPLRVALCIGERKLPLDCRVVRVQEPTWETLPGVGVRFVDLTPELRTTLEHELERLGAASPATLPG